MALQQETESPRPSTLQRILGSGTEAYGLNHMQRSDLQLLLTNRGLPIEGELTDLRERLKTALADEVGISWTTVPHVMWAPRREWPVVFSHQQQLYLFSGRDTLPDNMLLRFSSQLGRFEAVKLDLSQAARFPRGSLTCSTTMEWNGNMYIFAGRKEVVENNTPKEECINDMFMIDFETKKMECVDQQGMVPTPREGATAVLCGDTMLMYGGVHLLDHNAVFEPRNCIPVFHLPTQTWSQWRTHGTPPPSEETIEAAALHNSFMYIMTWNEHAGFTMYRLDIKGRRWAKVSMLGNVPRPRCEFIAVQWRNKWVIQGGYMRKHLPDGGSDWDSVPCNDVFMFDFDSHTWEQLQLSPPLLSRGQHSACLWGDTIVIAGGHVMQQRTLPSADEEEEEDDTTDFQSTHDHVEAMMLLPSQVKQTNLVVNSQVPHCFRAFYNNHSHSDVVLRCQGQQFPAHRLVLAAQSKMFDKMLQTDMKEGQTGEVDIEDMRPDTLTAMLRFMYGCLEEITADVVIDLFRAADHYQVDSLRSQCLDLMIGGVDAGNVASLAALADSHDLPVLLSRCVAYASHHEVLGKVVASGAYLDLMKSNAEFAQRFMLDIVSGHVPSSAGAATGRAAVSSTANKKRRRR